MAERIQVDWVAIKLEAENAVKRAQAAVAFTENQLRGFEIAGMKGSMKKYQQRLLRQKQHLAEAEAVYAEVKDRK